MANLTINIGEVRFKNPALTASGTFGYGVEFNDFIDLNELGGFVVKGTTLHHREGNPYPRMAETPSGMLNAVGLQNKGVDYFIDNIYPDLKNYDSHCIVNVSGSTIDEYCQCAEKLNELDKIPAIELNISCPNVKRGGMGFGTDPGSAFEVVNAVRKSFRKTMIVKLSPNVTDICSIAKAVESAGADSVSLINTLLGMAVDIQRRKPLLSTVTGGLSGPAIKPVALRMVYQVYKAIDIPIIGLGGIMNWQDAIEFILCGATAIQIGTANFIDPTTTIKVIQGINEYLESQKETDINNIIGCLHK